MKNLVSIFVLFTLPVVSQNFQWVKQDGGAKITHDKADNIYVAGIHDISKYDSNGNFKWQETITGADIVDLDADSSGSIYVLGNYSSQVIVGSYQFNADGTHANTVLVKYNSAGVVQWAIHTCSNKDAHPDDIAVDAYGYPYIVGVFLDSIKIDNHIFDGPETPQIFLAKYSTNGYCLWAKHLESWGFQEQQTLSVLSCDNLGYIYIAGDFYNHATFDSISIQSHNSNNAYDQDVFLTKLDTGGIFIWAINLGGEYQEFSETMDVDSAGNSYVCGYYSSPTAYFGTYTLSTNNYSFFTCKYDPNGSCLWVKQAYAGAICATNEGYFANYPSFLRAYDGAAGILQWSKNVGGAANSAMTYGNGALYMTGIYAGTVSFDTIILNANGTQAFLAKINGALIVTGIRPTCLPLSCVVFPNPACGMFNILYTSAKQSSIIIRFTTYDGQLVHSENILNFTGQLTKSIDLGKQAKGIYFIEILEGDKRTVRKIVLE